MNPVDQQAVPRWVAFGFLALIVVGGFGYLLAWLLAAALT